MILQIKEQISEAKSSVTINFLFVCFKNITKKKIILKMQVVENYSIKLFKCNVDFVYEALIQQFINNNGQCDEATFFLINWGILFDYNNSNKWRNYIETRDYIRPSVELIFVCHVCIKCEARD